MLDLRGARVRSVFQAARASVIFVPSAQNHFLHVGVGGASVAVLRYRHLARQGPGRALVQYTQADLSIAIQGGTPLKEIVVDGIHHVFFLIEVCGWCWSSLRTWRIAFHMALHWGNTNRGEIPSGSGAHRYWKRRPMTVMSKAEQIVQSLHWAQ